MGQVCIPTPFCLFTLLWVSFVSLLPISSIHAQSNPPSPPQLLSATYQIRKFSLDEESRISLAYFELTFDQSIYVNGYSLFSNNHTSNTSSWGYPVNASVAVPRICLLGCYGAPYFTLASRGSLTLTCGDPAAPSLVIANILRSSYYTSTFLPLPPSQYRDGLLSLLQSWNLFNNITIDVTPTGDNILTAFIPIEVVDGRVQLFTDSAVRDRMLDASFMSTCTVRARSLNITNAQGIAVNTSAVALSPFNQTCVYGDLVPVASAFSTLVANMSAAKDWAELQSKQLVVSTMSSHPAIARCQSLTESYLNDTRTWHANNATTECMYDERDPIWAGDACCNTTLQWDTCCVARPVNLTRNEWAALTERETVQATCKNKDQASHVLQDYIQFNNAAQDPYTGCVAEAEKVANQQAYDTLHSFIEECRLLVTEPPPCVSDDDCYTSCDTSKGRCNVALPDPDGPMVRCHMDRMHPTLRRYLIASWSLATNVTDDEFMREYLERLRAPNCVGATANQLVWRSDAVSGAKYYVTITQERCLLTHVCNYDVVATKAQCREQDWCASCAQNGLCDPTTYMPICNVYAATPTDCILKGGEWKAEFNPYECVLVNLTSEATCLDMSLCPPRDNTTTTWRDTRCAVGTCYTNDTIDTCVDYIPDDICTASGGAIYKEWLPTWGNGSGLCTVRTSSAPLCASRFGGKWWPGRRWIDGRFHTQQECEAGLCRTSAWQSLDLSPPICNTTFNCNITVRQCQSTRNSYYCFNTTTTDRCECLKEGGQLNSVAGMCAHPVSDGLECEMRGLTWVGCQDLDEDQCNDCAYGNTTAPDTKCPPTHRALSCMINKYAASTDSEMCEAGGVCSDRNNFFNTLRPECRTGSSFLPEICFGACYTNFSVSDDGHGYCPATLTTGLSGCFNYSAISPELCNKPSFRWVRAATTKTECEQRFPARCYEQNDLRPTVKSPEECNKCSGRLVPVYEWKAGGWVPRFGQSLSWIKGNWTSVNRWQPTLDFNLVEKEVTSALTQQFALARQTKALCQYNPMLETFKRISCDCTNDEDNPTTCFSSDVSVVSVGVQRFCSGLSSGVRAGSISLSFNADTLTQGGCILVGIYIVAASQFELTPTQTLTAVTAHTTANPYSLVVNAYGVTVGQVLGDGARLTFDPASDEPAGSPLVLCLSTREDIEVSSTYGMIDIATTDTQYSRWTPGEHKVWRNTEGAICTNITSLQDNVYWPVARVDDWSNIRTDSPLFSSDVSGGFYFVGVLFLLLALVAGIIIGYVTIFVNRAFHLGKVITLFIILFGLVRGLHLLLLPGGALTASPSALPGFYLLSEVPIFLFFSAYTTFVFFWAEVAHFVNKSKQFLRVLRVPFIVTNAFLYVMFILFISIFHSLSPKTQPSLTLAYRLTIAICCLIVIAASLLFGGRVVFFQLRMMGTGTSDSTSGARKGMFRRMLGILLSSTFGLLLQVAFLLNSAFSKSNVAAWVALLFYILAEFLPLALLLYCVTPTLKRTELGKTPSGSTQNSGTTAGRNTPANVSMSANSYYSGGSSGGGGGDMHSARSDANSSRSREIEMHHSADSYSQ